VKDGAVRGAEKTISHMQRVIEAEPAFVCRAKNSKKHGHFDGARRMKPAIAIQRKSEARLQIVNSHCDRTRLSLRSQFFELLIQRAGHV
jgi:hypothetical protein